MYLIENPVLQRELLVNLRTPRSFILLFLYQGLLATVVFFAWPQDSRLDLTSNPTAARSLVDLFFLGQYVLASLMAPSFAAEIVFLRRPRYMVMRYSIVSWAVYAFVDATAISGPAWV